MLAANGSISEVAERLAVSEPYVSRAWARQRLGLISAGAQCNHVLPRLTFVCALRSEGLFAPLVLDGPINGRAFRARVEQALAPETSW
ncbi:hypothetical protein FCG41_14690 [Azotobacter chroococcum]|nr:hypothetical protein FCG41_14690 [Azotobacter chroococcum]